MGTRLSDSESVYLLHAKLLPAEKCQGGEELVHAGWQHAQSWLMVQQTAAA